MAWRWWRRLFQSEQQINRRLRLQLAESTKAGERLLAALERSNSRVATGQKICDAWRKEALEQKHRAEDAERFLAMVAPESVPTVGEGK